MPFVRRSLCLFFLSIALAAAAQTATHPKARPTPPAKSTQPALPKNIPPVTAPMKTQYVMRYQDIKVGTGDLAEPGWVYSVHYTGWLGSDGTKFDSSVDRGQPIQFQQGIKRVITGWDQGFEGMHVGGKRRLFIPYQLAYGEKGRPPVIPPKADLIFDVELVDQLNPNAPPPQPPTQPAAPAQPNSPPQPQSPPQPPTSQPQ
jgi:peptidylprolyl isomerase